MTADREDRDGAGGDVPAADDRDDRPELDVDTAFAALVAQFAVAADVDAAGGRPWPDAENLTDADDDTRSAHDPATAADPAGPKDDLRLSAPSMPAPSVPPIEPPRPADRADPTAAPDPIDHLGPAYPRELDDHFVPPEPPPLPRGDLVSRLAWAGVIGGPLFLLIAAMASADLPSVLLLVALAAFIGGFVTLVARMPGEPPEDGDDGAVV